MFEAYLAGSDLILDAVATDGYADFWDTALGNRIRTADAGDGILRLAAFRLAVLLDIEAGRLRPESLGLADWADAGPEVLEKLAMDRLRTADDAETERAVAALREDPAWREAGLSLPSHEGSVPLTLDATDAPFQRSILSYLLPGTAAEILNGDKVWRALSEGAATGQPTRARLYAAHALAQGAGQIAPILDSILPVLVESARINPFAEITIVESDRPEPELNPDDILHGMMTLPDGRRAHYTMKSPDQVASEVRAQLGSGALDDLPAADRARLSDLAAEGLGARLEDGETARSWRAFGGAAIELALLGGASGGIGALAEGIAVGARATAFGVRASRFAATSGSFTTLAGLKSGDLSPQAFLRDAAMFKALSLAGRFSKLAEDLFVGGRLAFAAKPIGYGASSLSAGAVLTTYDALSALAQDQPESAGQLFERFVRHVALVTVLHAAHKGLEALAPHLAPGSAARAEHAQLQAQLSARAERTERDLAKLAEVAHPQAYIHPEAVAEAVARARAPVRSFRGSESAPTPAVTADAFLAQGPGIPAGRSSPPAGARHAGTSDRGAIESALARLETNAGAYESLVDDIVSFARRTAPEHLDEVIDALTTHTLRLEARAFGRMADLARDPLRTQVAGGLARPIPNDVAENLHEGQVAIFSRDLAPGMGLRGPRPSPADPLAVRRQLIGVEPTEAELAALSLELPRLEAHEVHGLGRYRLLSEGHNGSSASVFYGQLKVDGAVRPVAVKVPERYREYEAKEATKAHLLGELGIAPRVYGLVDLGKTKGLVMDAIRGEGDEVAALSPVGLRDLWTALGVMRRAGVSIADFQYMLTPEGRAVLMDAGSVTTGPPSQVRHKNHFIYEELNRAQTKLGRKL